MTAPAPAATCEQQFTLKDTQAMPSIPRLYVGAMNDALFIIDQPPRPIPVDCHNPNATPGVNVIAALGTDFALAKGLVDAWNSVLGARP